MGPGVPSLAVFLPSRPFGTRFIKPTTHSLGVSSSLLVNLPLAHWLTASVCRAPHRRLRSGLCFVLQAHAAEYFSCIAVSPRLRVSLHATLLYLVVRWLRCQPSRSPASPVLDACFLYFAPILGFGSSIDSPALVCFFSLDCDFLVVIVHVVSLSRCIVHVFSSGLFLQLHLVVVYSDLACGVTPALLCSTLQRRSRWTCASAVVYHHLVC